MVYTGAGDRGMQKDKPSPGTSQYGEGKKSSVKGHPGRRVVVKIKATRGPTDGYKKTAPERALFLGE